MKTIAQKVWSFVSKQPVFCIAGALAVLSCFLIPLDRAYASYIDYKTIACLFATLCVVCALKNIRFFTFVASKIIHVIPNFRYCVLALLYITFIGSLFIANDMALITFLPLGYHICKDTDNERFMPTVFVLQNISANLGGMLTPFGNPQNLYLYSKFQIDNLEFMQIMVYPFLLSVLLLTLICFWFPSKKIELTQKENLVFYGKRAGMYLVLFVLSLLAVFRVVPYLLATGVIVLALLVLDRKALSKVDYFLLGTFCFFFVFAGNVARVEVVREFLSSLLEKNTLLVSTLCCQLISNVPSAILLSSFTENYRALLLGVNIGGTGTLIASLASLITFSTYARYCPSEKGRYFKIFTILNALFLGILLIFCLFLEKI